ncbi:MAG: cohesin domain-containing protein [Candidatus Paceibacterota bacterium]|jgi:hypothetical protein
MYSFNKIINKKTLLFLSLFLFVLFFFTSHNYVSAATMYAFPNMRAVTLGQEFIIDIKIDTSDTNIGINSAQATIQFPVGIVSVVNVDKQSSTFGFWLEEPTVSNSNGTIHFIGGSVKGVLGSTLQILRIKFKAIGVGTADFKIVDAAVTSADGKGTNTLSSASGVLIGIGTNVLPPPIIPQEASVELPAQVIREAVISKKLPIKPVLRVPLYPDETRWYNRVGDVIVLWDLPEDVTQVATRVSYIKDAIVGTPEKTLTNGKGFGPLKDGIWYIKVQFKNNIGWSEPAYYKISLDTTVPVPFDIKIDSVKGTNPSPIVQFETNDSLSGNAGYAILVDGKELKTTTSTIVELPIQSLGKHVLVIRANDFAGNSVQDSIEFEVLPLPTPLIKFVTKSVSQGEFVFVSGDGEPLGTVDVRVVGQDGREVSLNVVAVESDGRWDITINEPLAIGTYLISAISHDSRGAMSSVSVAQQFSVRAKSIISFGYIELSWFEILIMVILLVIAGASLWSRKYIIKKQKRGRYNIIVGRDIEKFSDLLLINIRELSKNISAKGGVDIPQLTHLLGTMNENVEKLKRYITQELEKLK